VYHDAPSVGVGLSFFMIAFGQAIGAPAVGALIEVLGGTTTFIIFAVLGTTAAAVRPHAATPANT
jgi:hypothetical protein